MIETMNKCCNGHCKIVVCVCFVIKVLTSNGGWVPPTLRQHTPHPMSAMPEHGMHKWISLNPNYPTSH